PGNGSRKTSMLSERKVTILPKERSLQIIILLQVFKFLGRSFRQVITSFFGSVVAIPQRVFFTKNVF
ncbi:hypothetical protein N8549_00760, partial [bacterium]|nr:hypothetical protein [bacterium]